jgi:hypothetical protein
MWIAESITDPMVNLGLNLGKGGLFVTHTVTFDTENREDLGNLKNPAVDCLTLPTVRR